MLVPAYEEMLSNYAHRNDLAFANIVCDSSELGGLHTWDGYRKVNIIPRQIDYIMIDEASVLASGLVGPRLSSDQFRSSPCSVKT